MADEVTLSLKGKKLTAKINCEIDHHLAGRIREKIDHALFQERPEWLLLDFSEVRFMDSSGIALILGRVESARAIGANVRLAGLSDNLLKLVRLAGLDKIAGLYHSNL